MPRIAEQQFYVNDGYASATSGRTFGTINPTTGEVLTTVQVARREDVDRAVESVQRRQRIWATMTAMEHSHILRRAVDLLRQRNDELARLETLDTGRPPSEAAAVDIVTGADVLEYYVGLIPALEGSQIPLHDNSLVYTRREPLGVVARIGAWNYPTQIALWGSAPALAAGNAMIFKPSEVTPPTAFKLTEIYSEVSLSNGVSSVLPGIGTGTGRYLAGHPSIAKISFTGSVASGEKVMANSATSSPKEATMELNGKSPLIIADDADLDLAVDIAMMANFYSSGQVCTDGTRVFVPARRKAEFEHKILERVDRIHPGNLFADDTNFDPLVSFPHCDNILRYIESGRRKGARPLCGGEALKGDGFDNGAWVAPTVFIDYNDEMTIVREGIFGPVMSILNYTDETEVIRRANATEYNLTIGVVTPNLNRAHRLIHQLGAGVYWINSWGESPAEMPVGDYRHSGIGRENGIMALQSYTQVRSIQAEMGRFQSIFQPGGFFAI